MSDENTARHAECTVEFDGVDITSRGCCNSSNNDG